MVRESVRGIVTAYVETLLRNRIRVTQAILFGSCARGEADDESDIDIAIISPDLGRDRLKEGVMLKLLTEQIDTSLSPRPYSPEEVKQSSKGTFLYDEILSKGVVVYLENGR